MMSHFTHRLTVEYAHTDMAGIVHFSEFFKYMEATEHAFFRSIGMSISMNVDGHHISWPRVSSSFDYQRPLRFEDDFDTAITIEKIGNSSLTYRCDVSRHDLLLATGRTTSVCCEVVPGEGLKKIPIPDEIRSKFEQVMNRPL
ncbi:MAG: acyl-CoA thioester hydrolase [Kiritimatiellia bacterium]|jgi:acyl-CoA thioester hydrolase